MSMADDLCKEVVESESTTTTASMEDLEDDDTYFQDIDLILEHGVLAEDVAKLKKAGIKTIKGLQMTMTKKLNLIKGFNDGLITQLRDACCKVALHTAFMTANELAQQRKQIFKLSTGSKRLDKLLGGGIEAMAITEVFGEFRTGKTQLCHTLCATAQMPGKNGYIGGKVFFIDTEHTFRPDRLRGIAERFNLDHEKVLDNVLWARAYNSEHQYQLLNTVATKLHEEAGVFKLIIIDSIMALFRVDYCGMGEIADRQQKLAQMLSRLQKISEEYNIAVFVTNQITSDFSGRENNLVGTATVVNKPIGGNIMAHASTTRILFTKGEGPQRIAKMFDSPELEESEAEFYITNGGIDDSAKECFNV